MNQSAIERGIEAANQLVMNGNSLLVTNEGKRKALDLIKCSEIAMVGSNGEGGYPNIKAMFKINSDDFQTVWFSTLSSSRRVSQFKEDPKACVYFFDSQQFAGLLLVGNIEIVLDIETKKRLWHNGWEAYYPQGITNPEYCILKFTAQWGNFYQGLQNISFEI
jgi:general stress protein 26